MPHHCQRLIELYPRKSNFTYVHCKEDESGNFIFVSMKVALVVPFCLICGAESPAHIDWAIQQKHEAEKVEESQHALSH